MNGKRSAFIGLLSATLLMSSSSAWTQQLRSGVATLFPYQIWLVSLPSDQSLVQARGYGSISPKEPDRAKAYIKAREVAYAQALSNLLMNVQGVRLQHQLRVRDYEVADQDTQMSVEGIVQGAEVLSERLVALYGAPAVEMVVGIRLPQPTIAEIPEGMRSGSTVPTNPQPPRIAKTPDQVLKLVIPREPARAPGEEGYTSVIIDARGLGLRSSMSPHILRPDGSEVWGTMAVDPDFAIAEGIAVYTRSLSEAQAHPRAGSNPLMIRAIGVSGPSRSDVILSDKAARLLKTADETSGFLKAFRVIFVID